MRYQPLPLTAIFTAAPEAIDCCIVIAACLMLKEVRFQLSGSNNAGHPLNPTFERLRLASLFAVAVAATSDKSAARCCRGDEASLPADAGYSGPVHTRPPFKSIASSQ